MPSNCLCFIANVADSTVSMSWTGTPTLNLNFQYSIDGITWMTFTPRTTIITLSNVGDKVYFKGNNPNGVSEQYNVYYKFIMTGSIAASGNIMSLIDDGACSCTAIPNIYCYSHMFSDCTSLTTAPELPATTLADYCYYYMFSDCSSLLTAPELPATILNESCYIYMFSNCTSLTLTPILPATTLTKSCYGSMFTGCSNIISVSSFSATTVALACCTAMFKNCTSLITPPLLLATTMTPYCYSEMFSGCTSLTIAPELPATTMAEQCYNMMFRGCTNLITPPYLPATTLATACYNSMFSGCISFVISDLPGDGYNRIWKIPSEGIFMSTYSLSSMFYQCAGTRSLNYMPGVLGLRYTYYTQNFPNMTNLTFQSGDYSNPDTKNITGLSSYQLTEEDLSLTPTPKTSPGYMFLDGWYNESSCLTKAVIGQEITGPTTLYGKVEAKYLVDIRGENDIQKNGIIQNARDYKLDTARKMLNDNIYIYAVTHDYDMGWELIE